jgi:DNA-binding IclR family transcriptional regulator
VEETGSESAPAENDTAAQTITSVERAADVLLLFGRVRSRTLGITEIADQLGMSKAGVHRVLSSLRGRGLIEFDGETKRYLLGPAVMTLGLRYLAALDVRQLALPELRRLSAATGETATLSLRTGDTRVYVDQVTPLREVILSVSIGVPFPLHAGASSKAFLAFSGDEQVAAYLRQDLAALTDKTVTDARRLRRELREIARRGWAESSGERQPGAGSVAAPVLDHWGQPAAVISVCGPAERFAGRAAECAARLLDVTRQLSATMGYSGSSDAAIARPRRAQLPLRAGRPPGPACPGRRARRRRADLGP